MVDDVFAPNHLATSRRHSIRVSGCLITITRLIGSLKPCKPFSNRPIKHRNRFHMAGLRKQIHHPRRGKAIAFARQHRRIPRQRGGVARNIHNALRQKRRVQGLHHGKRARARRVRRSGGWPPIRAARFASQRRSAASSA